MLPSLIVNGLLAARRAEGRISLEDVFKFVTGYKNRLVLGLQMKPKSFVLLLILTKKNNIKRAEGETSHGKVAFGIASWKAEK